MSSQKTRKNLLFVAMVGVLSALSIALLTLIPGLSIFPAAPFLKYDLMDVPMLIAGMLLGPLGGMAVLLIGSGIQALLFSADGWVGFLMHVLASGALVLTASVIYRKFRSAKGMVMGLALGTLAMALMMVPLNLIITVHVYGVRKEIVEAMIVPVILPFNLIKAALNSILTFFVVQALNPLMKKMHQRMERTVLS